MIQPHKIHRRLFVSLISISAMLATCERVAHGAFTVQFDPSQTSVVSNGSTQTIPVNLLIQYTNDGAPGTLSSFTFDIADPGIGLTFANPTIADVAWEVAPSLSVLNSISTIGAFNFTPPSDVVMSNGQTIRLMTLDFVVNASVTSGNFPLSLSFVDANRDPFLSIATSEFQFPSGTFSVSAIPEPSSFSGLALLGIAGWYRRQRQRRKIK